VPDPANPQCLNRYAYCLNNPLKLVDPSGHKVEKSDDPVISVAWELFTAYCPKLAHALEVSEFTFKFTTFSDLFGDGATTTNGYIVSSEGHTYGEIDINFNTMFTGSNEYVMAYFMAHESIHALANAYNPNHEDSYFEEVASCQSAAIFAVKWANDTPLFIYQLYDFNPLVFVNFLSSLYFQSYLSMGIILSDKENNDLTQALLDFSNKNKWSNFEGFGDRSVYPQNDSGIDNDLMNYLLSLLNQS
jgi:hypothetical protein